MKFDKDKLHLTGSQAGAVLTQAVWEWDAAMCAQEVCKARVLKSPASHLCCSKGLVCTGDVSEGEVGYRQPFCALLLVSLLQSCKMEIQEPRRGGGRCWTSAEDSAVLFHSLAEHPSPQSASSGSVWGKGWVYYAKRAMDSCSNIFFKCFCLYNFALGRFLSQWILNSKSLMGFTLETA